MDIKYTKSILKTNPNSKELADLLTFVPLVQIDKGKVTINPQGLKIVETQVGGKVHLVALEGQKQSLLYSMFQSNQILRAERKNSGLWISAFPRYDAKQNTTYLYIGIFPCMQRRQQLVAKTESRSTVSVR